MHEVGSARGPFPPNPSPYPLPVVRHSSHRLTRWQWIAILGGVATASTILIVVADLNISTPFSFTIPGGGCVSRGTAVAFPLQSTVSFRWHTTNGQSAIVTVVDSMNQSVYMSQGPSGGGFFTADRPQYAFNSTSCAPGVVDVTGAYTVGFGII